MLYFAYDGTIHGDWVSHYAIRLAAHDAGQQLHLVHIDEDHLATSVLDGKLRQIEEECGRLNVKLLVETCGRTSDVFAALVARLPPTPETLVVCGTRTRQRRWSFLAGTVTARLMRTARYPVLAIHVVQPGLLGLPRDFLLPVAGHPRGLQAGLPFLRLFAPDVARAHLLHVRRVSQAQFRWLGHVERLAAADVTVHGLASQGYRVIALAHRTLSADEAKAGRPDGSLLPPDSDAAAGLLEQGLILTGFLALEDPLRAEVPSAVERCRRAGIRVLLLVTNKLIVIGVALEIFSSWAILYMAPVQAILGTGRVNLSIYALAWLGVPLMFMADYGRKRFVTARRAVHLTKSTGHGQNVAT